LLSRLHPLPKLVLCCLWLAASMLIFDAAFQLATIVVIAAALILLERRAPLLVLALMVPFALFGFGFLTTSVLFRQESDFALRMAERAPFGGAAFSAGLVLFLRAIACGMVSALFVLTTDPGALVKAMMVSWRLSPRIGYSLFSALHLTRDLASEAHEMRLARAMRRGRPPRRIPGPIETLSLAAPRLRHPQGEPHGNCHGGPRLGGDPAPHRRRRPRNSPARSAVHCCGSNGAGSRDLWRALPEHPVEDRIDMLEMVAEVEQCFELRPVEMGGDFGVRLERRQEAGRALPCLHGVALDEPIGVLP
jgi:energy-coupling factor transport system permease protein